MLQLGVIFVKFIDWSRVWKGLYRVVTVKLLPNVEQVLVNVKQAKLKVFKVA